MNIQLPLKFVLVLLMLAGCAKLLAVELLPGVTYYDGPEKLTGKLAFLLKHDVIPETNNDSSASIYEFDLLSEKLKKLTDCPKGSFFPSFRGDVFCVVYCPGVWFQEKETNVFIYAESSGLNRTLHLERRPNDVAIAGDHAFFELQGYDFTNSGGYLTKGGTENETKIIDFDITKNQSRSVVLPDASQWQYQEYSQIHVPRGQTNVLHFYYNGHGKRLADGKDYRDGYYSYDARAGEIRWLAELLDDHDDDRYTINPSDGKVLKSFPKPTGFSQGEHVVHAISPDGKYAFVSFDEAVVAKLMPQSGYARTYYAADLTNGKVRKLLKDDVDHQTRGSISGVWWVESPR